MAKYFDQSKWEEAINHKDWYLRLLSDFKNLEKLRSESSVDDKQIKEEVLNFFEKRLAENKVFLAGAGNNWDKERKPIDTIVVHHTKNSPGITWQRLSAVHLLRLYVNYYAAPYDGRDKSIKGKPIYSNHFRGGTQVFYAYHWLVRMDGVMENLLTDDKIGWHAGNWDVNCRSVAICLDNNFEDSTPDDKVIESIGQLIKEKYPQIKKENILGHREINLKTTCPGNRFITDWKAKLIAEI